MLALRAFSASGHRPLRRLRAESGPLTVRRGAVLAHLKEAGGAVGRVSKPPGETMIAFGDAGAVPRRA